MSPERIPSTSCTSGSRSASSTAGPRPAMAALTSASSARDGTSEPRCTATSGSRTPRVQPAIDRTEPDTTRLRSVMKPKSGAVVPIGPVAAGVLNPTFQPRCLAPDASWLRRIDICAAMPFVTLSSAMVVELVPCGIQRARAAPAPQQQHIAVGCVVEAVHAARRGEDDVVFAGGLLAVVGVDRAVAADHKQKLVA